MRDRSALVVAPRVHGADGASAVTRLAVGALVDAGVATEILTLTDEVRRDLVDAPARAPVASADGSRWRFVADGWRTAARRSGPDMVIVTHLQMLPAVLPLLARGVPVLTFLLGVECWRRLPLGQRWLLSRSARLLPISQWTRRQFVAANPSFAARPMTLCPPGVMMDAATGAPPVPGRALVVGRLWKEERYKGHDLLIDVWPQVLAARPDATLVVVGDGDDRDRLEARVRDANLSASIQFTGVLPQIELRRRFDEAQVFVMPSDGEGFGIVFLEAMRAARACIGARGAAEEIIVDGETGCLVTPRDARSLAAALVRLLQNADECDALGRAGRLRVEREFSAARFGERLLGAMREAGGPC